MTAICGKLIRSHADPRSDLLHGQLNTDPAGGADKHIFRLDPQAGSSLFRHLHRALITGQTGTGIGNTAVNDHGADRFTACASLAAELHRRSREEIAGKCAREVAGQFRKEHGEIRLPAFLETAGNTGCLKTGRAGNAAVFHKTGFKIHLFVHHFT